MQVRRSPVERAAIAFVIWSPSLVARLRLADASRVRSAISGAAATGSASARDVRQRDGRVRFDVAVTALSGEVPHELHGRGVFARATPAPAAAW